MLPRPPAWGVLTAAVVWGVVALWRGCRIALGLRAVAALKREAVPFDPARAARLPLWRTLSASGRPCALRVSDRSAGAYAVGFRRPVILVPRSLAADLSDAELDQVIAHEHAHLARYDDWLRLLQCGVAAMVGLHPAVWLADRQLDLEREAACDDRVVARTGDARAYADCLASVAAILAADRPPTIHLVPAVTRSGVLLRSRVRRLIHRNWHRTPHVRWLPAAVCLVALSAVVTARDRVPPIVTFDDAYVDSLPAIPIGFVTDAPPAAMSVPATTDVDPPAPARAAATRRALVSRSLVATAETIASRRRSVQAPVADEAGSAMGETLNLDEPLPLVARQPAVTSLEVSLPSPRRDAPSAPAAVAGATDYSWSGVGSDLSHAGVAVGKGAQHFGQALGGWFAGPWTGKHPLR